MKPSRCRAVVAPRPGTVMCERGAGRSLERRVVLRRYAAELNFRGWSVWVPSCGGWRFYAAPFSMLPKSGKEGVS